MLKGLLGDSDPQIASAAAAALGVIGTTDAAKALGAFVKTAPDGLKLAAADAYLACAEALLADEVAVRTTHGDIDIETLEAGRFDAVTTHSDVEIRRLSGAGGLLTTHGDVRVEVLSHDGLEIRTTHGDVSLGLPTGIQANLDLRGERVTMPSSLSFEGSAGKKHVEGRLNAGGLPIAVSTTFGEVRVRTD